MPVDLVALIVDKLQEMVSQEDLSLPPDVGSQTPLFGRHGLLDSLGLVSLVISVEQGIEDAAGVTVSLADERAFSRSQSPYLTVGSLAEYAESLMAEAA